MTQGTKNAFSVPRMPGLETFQNNSHNSNLGRLSDECMAISVLTPTAQSQKLVLIFSTGKMLVLSVRHHLVTWSTSLQMSTICFILGWQEYGKVIFQCVSLL